MKMFWSWQLDTPAVIGKRFIRDALDSAIKDLRNELTVEECERPDELHVDQDKQGIPGSPDIFPTILAKIEVSTIVIADVTSVGKSIREKKQINPNVAIELGYALKCLSDRKLIMIFNRHYGNFEDLPFDLRHKGGGVSFNLSPDASKEEIKTEAGQLKGALKVAIRDIIKEESALKKVTTSNVASEFARLPAEFGISLPFGRATDFCQDIDTNKPVRPATGSVTFVRIAPLRPQTKQSHVETLYAVRNNGLHPVGHHNFSNGSFGRSAIGAFSYWFNTDDRRDAQCFLLLTPDGEIWSARLGIENRISDFPVSIPGEAIQNFLPESLNQYASYLFKRIPDSSGFWVQAGFDGIKGVQLAYGSQGLPVLSSPSIQSQIDIDGIYTGRSTKDAYDFLEPLFQKLWDACGIVHKGRRA
ncbi:MAG: hypothetical protein JNN22_01790 [Rhodospirillales bacterium]|nr:hypothetical protein [Rhodospirillales bacterium]